MVSAIIYIYLPSYAGCPSSAWLKSLAYASLAFSVLAVIGAVLAKQWLDSYMAGRRQDSLEERIRRRMKMDKLEQSYFPAVLQAFFVFVPISILLFSLSVCGNLLMTLWHSREKV
ncbi:hypothetical protein BDR04DRAFT_1095157 [Suillus decipiens]|nr:hypothetical protein BDR04DRAFT_1095157 [Suillus decipiens]